MEFSLDGAFRMSDEAWEILERVAKEAERKSTLTINIPDTLPFVPGIVILNGIEYIRKEEVVDEQGLSGGT